MKTLSWEHLIRYKAHWNEGIYRARARGVDRRRLTDARVLTRVVVACGGALNAAKGLRVEVAERHGRAAVVIRLGQKFV